MIEAVLIKSEGQRMIKRGGGRLCSDSEVEPPPCSLHGLCLILRLLARPPVHAMFVRPAGAVRWCGLLARPELHAPGIAPAVAPRTAPAVPAAPAASLR